MKGMNWNVLIEDWNNIKVIEILESFVYLSPV